VKDREKLSELKIDPVSLKDDGKRYEGWVRKPWGREHDILTTGDFSIWRLYLEHGQETSMHCHPNKNTVMVIEAGRIRLETLDGETFFDPGQVVLIEKGVFHRTKATYPSGGVVLELEFPPNRCDIVRLEDRYGRGQGYA
jgi:mannose-6-phosphate isomerase-like protein (cupin superfamily)